MKTTLLLDSFAERGIIFSTEGPTLYAEPSARLTDSDRAEIRATKPALLALIRLREAAAARISPSGHVAVDKELSDLWRAAIEANAPDVVNIEGKLLARRFWPGDVYDGHAAQLEAQRQRDAGEITAAQFAALMAYASEATP